MKMRVFKLVGTTPVEVYDIEEWSRGENLGPIAHTAVGRDLVSTTFLGIDHSFRSDGPPILFETMVFGSRLDGEQHRTCTYQDAVHQHRCAVLCLVELRRQRQQGLIDLAAGAAFILWTIFFG